MKINILFILVITSVFSLNGLCQNTIVVDAGPDKCVIKGESAALTPTLDVPNGTCTKWISNNPIPFTAPDVSPPWTTTYKLCSTGVEFSFKKCDEVTVFVVDPNETTHQFGFNAIPLKPERIKTYLNYCNISVGFDNAGGTYVKRKICCQNNAPKDQYEFSIDFPVPSVSFGCRFPIPEFPLIEVFGQISTGGKIKLVGSTDCTQDKICGSVSASVSVTGGVQTPEALSPILQAKGFYKYSWSKEGKLCAFPLTTLDLKSCTEHELSATVTYFEGVKLTYSLKTKTCN